MHQALFLHYRGSSSTRFSPGTCAYSCVDGPRLARDHLACSAEVACSHVSGLLVQSGWTAGPDGVREPSPHHSNGIDVPMRSQVWLGCVGSTDCAITRHCSLASSRTWLSGRSWFSTPPNRTVRRPHGYSKDRLLLRFDRLRTGNTS